MAITTTNKRCSSSFFNPPAQEAEEEFKNEQVVNNPVNDYSNEKMAFNFTQQQPLTFDKMISS